MNSIENREKIKEKDKYKSFLQIIALISICTIGFEGIILLGLNTPLFGSTRFIAAIASMAILAVVTIMGFAIAKGTEIWGPMDSLVEKADQGRFVTIMFFAFLVSNLLFIMQDGGAQNSVITDILLLSVSFGFFFAKKKYIRVIVLVSCLVSYTWCSIFYYDMKVGKFIFHSFSQAIIPAFVVLFIAFINVIITAKIKEY